MSLPADKGLFQKLRKPLPDSAFDIQPQKKQEKTHKDFLFPIAAVTVVAAVIFAPEFVKQNNSDISVQKTTQKFHKLSLPQEEAQQPFQKRNDRFSLVKDTAENALSTARIAADNMQFEKAFTAYNKAAQIYFDQERYSQSYAVSSKSLSLLQNHVKKPYSKDLQKAIITFWNLQALNEKALKNSESALYAAQKSFDQTKALYGSDHLETAHSYNLLGQFYQNHNDIMNALQCQYSALKIYKKRNYLDIGTYLIKMNNLGEHYRLQKSYSEAEKIISETIHFIENKYGSDVPELAVPLNNLGLVKYAKQERTKAEAFLMRAYQISRKYQSSGHDVTGYIASNLERVQKGTSL